MHILSNNKQNKHLPSQHALSASNEIVADQLVWLTVLCQRTTLSHSSTLPRSGGNGDYDAAGFLRRAASRWLLSRCSWGRHCCVAALYPLG